MKIAFFETDDRKQEPNRLNFQKKIKNNDITLIDNVSDLDKYDFDVLFIHESNEPVLKISNGPISNWLYKLDEVIKISWGGNTTRHEPININDKKIKYLCYKYLEEKLQFFNVFFSSPRTIEEIYSFLFDVNDEIEDLLKPFTKISPFNKKDDYYNLDGKESKVVDAFEAINNYVNKL
jgi:hypothetical protein